MTWTAVAGVLTALGAAWTFYAWRNRGVASGLRGAGLTLLPVAAWATGSLEMLAAVSDAVARWATGLVFNPLMWVGIAILGVAVVLFGAGNMLSSRGRGERPQGSERRSDGPPEAGRTGRGKALPPSSAPPPPVDDDLADIEAILRRRGID